VSEELASLDEESTKVGASVWRLGPGGTLLASIIEDHAGELAERDRNAIYFFAELEGSADLKFDEGTMRKVFEALATQGLSETQCINATNAMQNAGVLFRENA
jgi:hypothetical protein